MKDMEITVRIKNVYGKELIYPVDENAEIFCRLTHTVTLSKYDIQRIKLLGFTVNVEQSVAAL